MKTEGLVFIVLGVVGAIFVSTYDIILGKAMNYIGPRSIVAFFVCALLIIRGVVSFLKKPRI